MWEILGTIVCGALVIVLYKTYTYVSDSCYLYKRPCYGKCYSLVNNFKGCVKAVLRLLNRHPRAFRVVGMDCEMTSTSVKGGHPVPAILQLANPDGYCAIFQLTVIENSRETIVVPYLTESPKKLLYKLPSENVIKEVLENPNILKVGVAVINDAKYLEKKYGLFCKGCLDVRHLAKRAGYEPKGLDYLAQKVLRKEKLECKKNRKKPWESAILSPDQIEYALQDSRLGVELFLKMNEIVIERSYSWLRRLFWDEKTYWKYSLEQWNDYVGKPFEFSSLTSFDMRKSWNSYIPRYSLVRSMFGEAVKYVPFNLESMSSDNVCCVCGILDNEINGNRLKAIVPVDYNVEFEDDHLYYIRLCRSCFEESRTKVDYELRQELTEECGAPYPDYGDHRLETVKKLAMELLSHGSGKEWTQILEHSLHKLLPELTYGDFHVRTMETILSMDCWPETEHGRFVHDYFCLYGGGLDELRWRWCERFWRVMSPQHLPWKWQDFYRRDPRFHWIMS